MDKDIEKIAKWLMLRDGLNDDWYYDCRATLAEAEDGVQKYEAEAERLLKQLGYHKLQGESPLLKSTEEHPWSTACIRAAKAQRDLMIKWMREEK